MPGPTSKSTWTAFERRTADRYTKALGLLCRRNPLSGASNTNDKGERRGGDVIIHSDFDGDILVEDKLRSSHAHHKLFRAAQADAKKDGKSHAILHTKVKGEVGDLTVMDSDLFFKMLEIPEVQKLLQKPQESDWL